MTLISTTDEERRVDERDGLKKSLRLKYVDVEVKWSCRGLYPSKGPEGLSGWWWKVRWVGSGIKACAWWRPF